MAISTSMVALATTIGIYAMLAIALNIKFGFTGLLEIGHVAFYLLGGYVTALLVLPPAGANPGQIYILGLGLPWIVAIPIAMAVCAIFGAVVSLPAIRLREDFLAITLLGMAFIVQQIFRSERWLANGPRALAGFNRPYNEAFPVPGGGGSLLGIPPDLLSAIAFGLIAGLFWTIAVLLLRRWRSIDASREDGEGVLHLLFALTTLGAGYGAARLAGRGDQRDVVYAGGAGVGVGLVALVLTAALPPTVAQFVVLLLLGSLSLFSWVYAFAALQHYYSEVSLRELGIALGFGLAFLATFVPLVALGSSQSDLLAFAGMLVWVGLLAGYIYGLYWLSGRWDEYGEGTPLIRLVGIAAIVVFLVRYFVLSLLPPASRAPVLKAVFDTLFNVVWLAQFDLGSAVDLLQGQSEVAVTFGYSRFLFAVVVAALVVVYVLSEITIKSPFGRVLKAIREDEDVATALGKNTFLYKVQSMAVGSAIAGLAGALTAIQFQSLTWSIFRIEVTFFALLMVIIGGTANNRGAILGSVIFWGFSRGTTDIAGFFPSAAGSSIRALRLVIIGALLIVILYYRPEGLWGEEHGITEAAQGAPAVESDGGREVSAE
jgi:ABC-type branched-subunit amino acid transport system permease subunit